MRMVRRATSRSTRASRTRRHATGCPHPGHRSCSEDWSRLGLNSATRWAARSGAVVMSTVVMRLLSQPGGDGFAHRSAYALTHLVGVQQVTLAHAGLVLGDPADRPDHRAVVRVHADIIDHLAGVE